MQYLIPLLCLCGLFVPTLVGVGFTFLAERQLGRWAYVVGGLLPVVVVFILYGAYDIALRVTACEPADSLACGEPLAGAFLFSVGFICVTLIASASAQAAVFFFLNGQRYAQMQPYMEMDMEGEMQPYDQGYTQTDNPQSYMPASQGYVPQEEMQPYTPQAGQGYVPQEDMPPYDQGYTQQQDPQRYSPQEDELKPYMRPDEKGNSESGAPPRYH